MALSKAIRGLLFSYLSCTAWSYVLGTRDNTPDVPSLRVPDRVVLARIAVHGQQSGRSLDLGTRDAVAVVPISAKLARKRGYPGFADADDGRPALSRREFEDRVDIVTPDSAAAQEHAVRTAYEKTVAGTSPTSLLAKRQAVHTNIDYGDSRSTCSISGMQAREISFRYIFDAENRNLKILPSGVDSTVGMPSNVETAWDPNTRETPLDVPFTASLAVEVSTPNGLSWCCTITWAWTQHFIVANTPEQYILSVQQPADREVSAQETCITPPPSGAGCKAAAGVSRTSCSAASVDWQGLNGNV